MSERQEAFILLTFLKVIIIHRRKELRGGGRLGGPPPWGWKEGYDMNQTRSRISIMWPCDCQDSTWPLSLSLLSFLLLLSRNYIRFPGSPRTARRPAGLMHLGLLYYDLVVDIMVIAFKKYVLLFLEETNAITTRRNDHSSFFYSNNNISQKKLLLIFSFIQFLDAVHVLLSKNFNITLFLNL